MRKATHPETLTTRIRAESHRVLKTLSEEMGVSMLDTIDVALEALRRKRFLEAANRAYAELRADPEAWQEELNERELWDTATGPWED